MEILVSVSIDESLNYFHVYVSVHLIDVRGATEFLWGILSDANVDCLGFKDDREIHNVVLDIDVLRPRPIGVKSVIVSVSATAACGGGTADVL